MGRERLTCPLPQVSGIGLVSIQAPLDGVASPEEEATLVSFWFSCVLSLNQELLPTLLFQRMEEESVSPHGCLVSFQAPSNPTALSWNLGLGPSPGPARPVAQSCQQGHQALFRPPDHLHFWAHLTHLCASPIFAHIPLLLLCSFTPPISPSKLALCSFLSRLFYLLPYLLPQLSALPSIFLPLDPPPRI